MRRLTAALLAVLLLSLLVARLTPDRPPQPPSLEGISLALADLAAQVSPAVVQVSVQMTVEQFLEEHHEAPGIDPEALRQRVEADGVEPFPPIELGAGSGFVIDADEGFIVTNHHVVVDASGLVVVFQDGRQAQAELVAADALSDLAVIRVPAELTTTALSWGDASSLRPGELVMACGSPLDLFGSVSIGVLSAKGRNPLVNIPGGYEEFLQFDATIDQGSSGGPLCDVEGRVVGVNSAISGESWSGIGFAVPETLARPVIDALIAEGEVRRGYLGIRLESVTAAMAARVGLPYPYGVAVGAVEAGTPAEAAGLEQGDLLLALDGERIQRVESFRVRIASHKPGDKVLLTVFRDGDETDLSAVLGRLH